MQARNRDAGGLELLQLVAQGTRADPEALRGQFAAAAGDAQGRQYQLALALLEIMVESDFLCRRRNRRCVRIAGPSRVEVRGIDAAAGCEPGGPLHDIGQLARVSGPIVLQQLALGSGGQAERRMSASRASLNGAARQGQNIAAALAERR